MPAGKNLLPILKNFKRKMNFQVNEFSSFKVLLKQVYSAHTSKVKELENEIKVLREQLTIKIGQNKDISDCKRCAELESAFKSCKKALQEQSKFFESFGQKFSIFNDSERGSLELKPLMTPTKINVKSDANATISSKDESSTLFHHQDSPSNSLYTEPSAVSSHNLLKNIWCKDESYNTFDLFSEEAKTLKEENSFSKKFDETIFAPDSVDLEFENKKGVKRRSTDCFSEDEEAKKSSSRESKNCTKRNSEPSSNISSGSLSENCSKKSQKISKSVPNEEESKNYNKNQSVGKKMSETSSKLITDDKTHLSIKNIETEPKILAKAESVVFTEKKNVTPKASFSSSLDNKLKLSGPYETSPSLILKTSEPEKKIVLKTVENDDDFIEIASSNSKSNPSGDSNSAGIKQKPRKKTQPIIRCTSKYKMTLDAPPLNYRKNSFKQSKLSKSFFQGKKNALMSNSKESNSKKKNESIPTILLDQTSTPTDSLSPVDIDATFIPDNYERNVTPLATTNVEKSAAGISNLRHGSLFSNISFLEDLKPKSVNAEPIDYENSPLSENDPEYKENMNSFDRLPVPEEPKYKYKNDVIRSKVERKQLNGFDCQECEKYYSELGLSEKEKQERMKKCSRHRGKFAAPSTPDHFWELDFPDTEECKNRGYMDETQKVKLKHLAS